MLQDVKQFLLLLEPQMLLQNLRYEHLPCPDHASPPSVSHIAISLLIGQFFKSEAVGHVQSVDKPLVDEFVDCPTIVRIGREHLAQNEEILKVGEDLRGGELFEIGESLVFEVVARYFEGLAPCQSPRVHEMYYRKETSIL